MNGYTLTFGGLLLLGGRAGDILGLRLDLPHRLAGGRPGCLGLACCWPRARRRARAASSPDRARARQGTAGGRFSYGVLSTIVVRVDTPATPLISCSRSSSAAGEATRTLRM